MILITRYNSNTLQSNIDSGIFKKIYVKPDHNIILNDIVEITELSDFEIVNKQIDTICIISDNQIIFNKCNININEIQNDYIYKAQIDNYSSLIIKSPTMNQKIVLINDIFNCIIKIDYYIYINAFWSGFIDKNDGNTIEFFENIFKKTKLSNYKITDDINNANVLFESVFGKTMVNDKKWKYKIHYSGEPFVNKYSDYDLVLYSENTQSNIVDVPLFTYYIHGNNFLDKLINRPIITKVPEYFCCFIVSNGNSIARNHMFDLLNTYKKVYSFGNYNNNMGVTIPFNYWTEEFRNILRNYKFIIYFENSKKGTYSTEKIVNPYLSGIIPIYWSSHHIKRVFNEESMLFLEDETELSYKILIDKIIELDNSDEKYLNFVNKPVFNCTKYWYENYTIESIAQKINNVL
jgi:hypothetical protein